MIATGRAADIFFQRGIPWRKWWYEHGHAWNTPAQTAEERARVASFMGKGRVEDPNAPIDVHTPGEWRGHKVQQKKIGGTR